MSYVTSYGGGNIGDMMQVAGNFVPGFAYAGRLTDEPGYQLLSLNGAKAMLAIGAGIVAVLLMISGFPVLWERIGMSPVTKSGMTAPGVWMGAQHNIQRSDVYGDKKRSTAISPFLGSGVGPEFVEQPNYVLGNENMQRTALVKYNRLKLSGAAVGTWPVFWAAYKTENSDDLDSSMYDFGDGMIDSKKFMEASRGN